MQNPVAIVTGASRGIGKAIAVKYAKEGYDLAICCLNNRSLLKETETEILSYHVSCVTFVGDIGKDAQAELFFQKIKASYDRIDVLINNAGISHIGLLQDMTADEWEHIISANLSSTFHCSKRAVKEMLKKKSGKILSISSVWGSVGASMEVAYSATKGGINAFTKALAKELAPSGIQVNAIACGAIDTAMNDFLSADEKLALLNEIPGGRMGTCEEVAELVFSINKKNDYLTGQVITFDGGWI